MKHGVLEKLYGERSVGDVPSDIESYIQNLGIFQLAMFDDTRD